MSSVVFWRFLRWNKVFGTVSVWGRRSSCWVNIWACSKCVRLRRYRKDFIFTKKMEMWDYRNYRKNTQIPFCFQQSSPGKLRNPGGPKVIQRGRPPPHWDGRVSLSDQYLSLCLVCDSPSTMTRSAVLCLAVSAAILGCGKNKELMQILLTARSIEAILFPIK